MPARIVGPACEIEMPVSHFCSPGIIQLTMRPRLAACIAAIQRPFLDEMPRMELKHVYRMPCRMRGLLGVSDGKTMNIALVAVLMDASWPDCTVHDLWLSAARAIPCATAMLE